MALKALKRTGTFSKTTSINSDRECCFVLASIQTRTIGIVIFGQRLLVLPALNPLCFTAFTITVSLMPSFKQPLSWDLGFLGDLVNVSCLACTPATLFHCILLQSSSQTMKRRSCSHFHLYKQRCAISFLC